MVTIDSVSASRSSAAGLNRWYSAAATPAAVAAKLWQNLADGFLLPHLWVTLSEILLGFLGGSLLGIGLGSLVAISPLWQRVLKPYIIASQAMPKLALAPLFVIWFGFGILPKALIAALIAFFPLFENTLTGLREGTEVRVNVTLGEQPAGRP